MTIENLTHEFWQHVKKQKDKTKIAGKVYNWLNYDNLDSIIADGDIYYLELTTSHATMPNYVFYYIKRFCNKKGLTYLYEYKTNSRLDNKLLACD